jgi:hypothetical protein
MEPCGAEHDSASVPPLAFVRGKEAWTGSSQTGHLASVALETLVLASKTWEVVSYSEQFTATRYRRISHSRPVRSTSHVKRGVSDVHGHFRCRPEGRSPISRPSDATDPCVVLRYAAAASARLARTRLTEKEGGGALWLERCVEPVGYFAASPWNKADSKTNAHDVVSPRADVDADGHSSATRTSVRSVGCRARALCSPFAKRFMHAQRVSAADEGQIGGESR